jgi:RNA polymerase sigma factor (sigma-70 family)
VAYDGDDSQAARDWSPVLDFVRRLARRRLRRADLAEDVAQETVLRLVEYGRGGVAIDNLYGLALRIAENLVNEQFRRERRWGQVELSDTLASSEPAPDRVIEGKEAVATLKQALAQMPALRRDIIIRRRVRHQSCAAIAADLGLSVKAVEKHMTRGLLDLNQAFGQNGRGRGEPN